MVCLQGQVNACSNPAAVGLLGDDKSSQRSTKAASDKKQSCVKVTTCKAQWPKKKVAIIDNADWVERYLLKGKGRREDNCKWQKLVDRSAFTLSLISLMALLLYNENAKQNVFFKYTFQVQKKLSWYLLLNSFCYKHYCF